MADRGNQNKCAARGRKTKWPTNGIIIITQCSDNYNNKIVKWKLRVKANKTKHSSRALNKIETKLQIR